MPRLLDHPRWGVPVTLDRSWMLHAKCRAYPSDLFFPPAKALNAQQQAANVCASCPVQDLCRAYADQTHATHGVWGGVFINRTGPTTGKFHTQHGTPEGARRHYKLGEKPCTPCREAARKHRAEYRAQWRKAAT